MGKGRRMESGEEKTEDQLCDYMCIIYYSLMWGIY